MENGKHDEHNCPHEGVEWPSRLDRPNHHYHDSLGCPFECTERHNHPVRK